MKKIIEYTDYRRYIADYYADRKARKSFTWRDFAKSAGFSSPVYLKLVAEGKYNLSEAAVERVAEAMGLRDWEVDYFKVLVSLTMPRITKVEGSILTKCSALRMSIRPRL